MLQQFNSTELYRSSMCDSSVSRPSHGCGHECHPNTRRLARNAELMGFPTCPHTKSKKETIFWESEQLCHYVHQHIGSWSATAVLIAEEFAWEFSWAPISQDVSPVQLLPFDLKLQCPVHPLIPLAALAHPGKRLCLSYEAPSSTAADQTAILRIWFQHQHHETSVTFLLTTIKDNYWHIMF